jgi:hypothetical protein
MAVTRALIYRRGHRGARRYGDGVGGPKSATQRSCVAVVVAVVVMMMMPANADADA